MTKSMQLSALMLWKTPKEHKRDSQGMRDPVRVRWDEDIGYQESFYGRNTTKTVFI